MNEDILITLTKRDVKKPLIFDKEYSRRLEIKKMRMKINRMFIYENMPDTIPVRVLENMLQSYGRVVIAKHNGELYAYKANPTGTLNEYYEHDKYLITNEHQKISKEVKLDAEGVLIRSDSEMLGLDKFLHQYLTFKVESNITILMNLILSRITNVIAVNDSDDASSVEKIYKDLIDGEFTSFQLDNLLSESNSIELGENNLDFTKIIEMDKYLKSEINGLLGMPENDNMKRSYISDTEINLQHQGSMYFVLNMLVERREGIERMNETFGTNVEVKLNPEWFGFIEEIKEEKEESEQMESNGDNESNDPSDDNNEDDNTVEPKKKLIDKLRGQ